MIAIYKFVNDICLNDREYLLDSPDGDTVVFYTAGEAITHLQQYDPTIQCEDDMNEQGMYLDEAYSRVTH